MEGCSYHFAIKMRRLLPHQALAVSKMKNGSVLIGGTGSGKSFTALTYFFEKVLGGSWSDPPIFPKNKINLYIITTPKKRDSLDWELECSYYGISKDNEISVNNIRLIIDSWNNIKKYKNVSGSFFIFDEQKIINYGSWSKTFIQIAKKNKWILLSATPADRWTDLMPIFIASGFYKNKQDFVQQHIIYEPYVKYPKIKQYINTDKLETLKDSIFVIMPFERQTVPKISYLKVEYDSDLFKKVFRTEWNIYKNRPVQSLAEHVFVLRKIINTDISRIERIKDIFHIHNKIIIFYNFKYELDILKTTFNKMTHVSEYNGDRHDPVPEKEDSWVYLVQYISGNEAWECFSTDTMVFYSMNYSFRIITQAMGRIDRLNTKYKNLYYYFLISDSILDKSILLAYNNKKTFNEKNLFSKSHRTKNNGYNREKI